MHVIQLQQVLTASEGWAVLVAGHAAPEVGRGCFGRRHQFRYRPCISRPCHVAGAQRPCESVLPAAVQAGSVAPAAC